MASLTVSRPSVKKSKPVPVVSLCLAIDHQCYNVTPITGIQTPEIARGWRLKKKSDGAVYDVVLTAAGDLECDCPDFTFRIKDQLPGCRCKHIKAAVSMGLLTPAAEGVSTVDTPAPTVPVTGTVPAPVVVEPTAPALVAGDPTTRDARHAAFMAEVDAENAARDAKWAAEVEASRAAPFAPAWSTPAAAGTGDAAEVDPWDVECDPKDWPADTDTDRWVASEPLPAAPVETPARAFEPTATDRQWWAAMLDGASRADRKPVRFYGSEPVRGWDDLDQRRVHGFCR